MISTMVKRIVLPRLHKMSPVASPKKKHGHAKKKRLIGGSTANATCGSIVPQLSSDPQTVVWGSTPDVPSNFMALVGPPTGSDANQSSIMGPGDLAPNVLLNPYLPASQAATATNTTMHMAGGGLKKSPSKKSPQKSKKSPQKSKKSPQRKSKSKKSASSKHITFQ